MTSGTARPVPKDRLRRWQDDDSASDSAVADLLGQLRTPTPAPTPPASDPATSTAPPPGDRSAEDTQPPAATAAPAADPDPAAATPPAEGIGAVRPTTFTLPAPLIDRLATHREVTGETTLEAILNALDALDDATLPTLFPTRAKPTASRFARPSGRGRRRNEGTLAQVHVRLRTSNYPVLDEMVEAAGATSRSELVTAALTRYLDPQVSP